MQSEYKIYSGILKIAERKTDCLIKNDIKALSAITEEEKKAAERTSQLNLAREQLLEKFCEETGQDYKKFTIEKLKDQVEESYRNPLEEIHEKLSQVLNKLSARNGINQKLIENAIKYINFNMQLIAAPQPVIPLYGRSGQEISHNNKRSTLDVKF